MRMAVSNRQYTDADEAVKYGKVDIYGKSNRLLYYFDRCSNTLHELSFMANISRLIN